MRFASIGSGSAGNGTLVEAGTTLVLVDCGFSIKETCSRMAKLGVDPSQLDAVLVTHEHGDHWKGVAPLARRYSLPIYLTAGTHHAVADDVGSARTELIDSHASFTIGELQVTPVAVPHDAREPVQFTFQCGGYKLGILTDIGSLTPHVVDQYSGCHGLLVEANHDLERLSAGPYPPFLKERVAGDWGHLNNQQTVALLEQIDSSLLDLLVIGHVSSKNNCLELLAAEIETLPARWKQLVYACQDEGFEWLKIAG